MIFDLTTSYTPESYADSRDYRIFLRLLGVLCSVFKNNIDEFANLYSPETCPEQMLQLLASMVGYWYDESLSVDDNRIVIKYFPLMLRYRGSREGIALATALSLNTSDQAGKAYSVSDIMIEYDYETGIITIYYPYPELIRKDLIEAVRVVGTRIRLVPASIVTKTEGLDTRIRVKITTTHERDSYKELRSQIGFGIISNTNDKNDKPD